MSDLYRSLNKEQLRLALISMKKETDQTIADLNQTIGDLKRQLDTLKTSINIQNAKLKLRPRIEKLERDVIPDFLLISTNFTENIKWRISLYFELTWRASILKTEIVDRGLSIETFVDAMTLAYHSSPEYISHDRTPGQILLSAAEWEVVFKDLNIFDQKVKESVILCVDDSIYKPRKREFTKPNNVFDFLVYVNCLSIIEGHGQNEIQEEIKEICERAILLDAGNKILDENFLFICDSLFFLINKVTFNDMKSIREKLLKMKGSPRIISYWKVSPF